MNQPMQDGLADALRRLREESAAQAAPDSLEGKLLLGFRSHHAAPRKQWNWIWVAASIAACLVVALVAVMREPMRATAPTAPSAAARTEQPAQVEKKVLQVAAAQKPKPTRKRRARTAGPRLSLASSQPAPEQEFIKIPYAPPFTPYDEAYVVRVNMPGSSVRRMGVPVVMDRVQADLVVGNDGLARAIRVVSY